VATLVFTALVLDEYCDCCLHGRLRWCATYGAAVSGWPAVGGPYGL